MTPSWTQSPPTRTRGGLDLPATPPPSGQVSDFHAPSLLLPWTIAVVACAQTIATSALLTRLFTQLYLATSVFLEDYLSILAWVAADVLWIFFYHHGMGKHTWDVSRRDLLAILKLEYWRGNLYQPTVILIRVPILLQFIRIFTPSRINRPLWIACWVEICVNVVFYLVGLIVGAVCVPNTKLWDPSSRGNGIDAAILYKATAVFDLISDITIIVLPLPSIYRLRLSFRRKLTMVAMFTAGLVACLTSIMRVYYTWALFTSGDILWNFNILGYWTSAEIAVGMLIFCLPVAPQFVRFIRQKTVALLGRRKESIKTRTDVFDTEQTQSRADSGIS